VVDFAPGTPIKGDLDVTWHAGWPSAKHDPAPEIQVHWYDPHTVILRQNRSVHYEAPFLFLLFGNDAALLIDTGATAEEEFFPLRGTVDTLVEKWKSANSRQRHRLIVAHTHAHGDHVAGDGQFRRRPDTTVVGAGLDAVTTFYGLDDWPDGSAEVDLGGRIVDVIPGPGHEPSATVFYDRYAGLVFTGDTLYPGRLYVRDWPAYVSTVDRLLRVCASRPVNYLLGCHIEMTSTPGKDYRLGSTYQPDEPPLQMEPYHLRRLRRALDEIDNSPGRHPYDAFIVHVLPGEAD
jgi:hydroxyacylglutathione hydrolase